MATEIKDIADRISEGHDWNGMIDTIEWNTQILQK